jgi:hypothetical protein
VALRSFISLAVVLLGVGIGAAWGRASRPPAGVTPEAAAVLPDGRPLGGRLRVESDHLASAALRAELPWSNEASLYGWGSVRVVGRPREDELSVRVIIDAPTAARRWQSECALELRDPDVRDDEVGTIARRAAYVGRPMDGGAMYDAIRVEMSIEEVRRLAAARHIDGSVCGDPIALGPEQLETLRAFVIQFDELATRTRPIRATEVLRAPEDPAEEEEPLWEDAG